MDLNREAGESLVAQASSLSGVVEAGSTAVATKTHRLEACVTWLWLPVPTALFAIAALLCFAGQGSAGAAWRPAILIAGRMGDRYPLLVNTAMAKQMDAAKIAQFDRSPYDGLAVSFSGAYDTSPVPSVDGMEAQVTAWKKSTAKDI